MDMGTGTGRIFIQWVGYGGATTRTLPAALTSLIVYMFHNDFIRNCMYMHIIAKFYNAIHKI